MAEYLDKRPDLDNRMIAFVAEIADEDMGRTFKFTDPRGTVQERNFGRSMLQFFNHETHHRGMISLYLELLGRENSFSNLI